MAENDLLLQMTAVEHGCFRTRLPAVTMVPTTERTNSVSTIQADTKSTMIFKTQHHQLTAVKSNLGSYQVEVEKRRQIVKYRLEVPFGVSQNPVSGNDEIESVTFTEKSISITARLFDTGCK
jgi:hypothetical protein